MVTPLILVVMPVSTMIMVLVIVALAGVMRVVGHSDLKVRPTKEGPVCDLSRTNNKGWGEQPALVASS